MKWKVSIKDMAKKFNKSEEEFLRRIDGRIEWVCSDGVGHTVWSPTGDYIHGCNGKCRELYETTIKEED